MGTAYRVVTFRILRAVPMTELHAHNWRGGSYQRNGVPPSLVLPSSGFLNLKSITSQVGRSILISDLSWISLLLTHGVMTI